MLNVATIGPTGHPHVVAMWFAIVDGTPAFWTFMKSQKVVNLRRDPRITALVESGEAYAELRGVELLGTGRLVEDFDEVLGIGRAVALRYQGDVVQADDTRGSPGGSGSQAAGRRDRRRTGGQLGPHEARGRY